LETLNVQRPRGTNDILPEESAKWHFVEEKIRELCRRYGYQEIRTPIFEHTELFERGIGEATDIVEKEMYTFKDRSDRSLTLRPEGTAGVVRAFVEHSLDSRPLPVKLYYLGPMFRYEKPQAGRYRQFTQLGLEAIGSMDPFLDVEMIMLPIELYRACGLDGFQVQVNSIGCPKCRGEYREVLLRQLGQKVDQLCPNCRCRLYRNPLRILDCKEDKCRELVQEVPPITDYLCSECAEHFHQVKAYLDQLGINYVLNPRLVRGFDYYTKTVFEIQVPSLGAQNAIGGGGRYDGLVEEVGGKPLPAVGYAVGLERLLLALDQQAGAYYPQLRPAVYVARAAEDEGEADGGAAARRVKAAAVEIVTTLRREGLWVEMDYLDRKLRAQMKTANKLNCRWVVFVGESELKEYKVKVRNMDTGDEQAVELDKLTEYFKGAGEE